MYNAVDINQWNLFERKNYIGFERLVEVCESDETCENSNLYFQIFVITLKYLINEYTRLDNATLFLPSLHFFSHTRLLSCQKIFHILLLDHTRLKNLEKFRIVKPTKQFRSFTSVVVWPEK